MTTLQSIRRLLNRRKRLALIVTVIIMATAASLAIPAGFFSIDELIYALMAESATKGSLVIENGYSSFPSTALLVRFLVPGPDGSAPQYPSGYGFFALPFYSLLGIRGLFMMNSLAFAGSCWCTYSLARSIRCSKHTATLAWVILGGATYASEYGIAVWPHALAMLVVVAGQLAAFRAARQPSASLVWAVLTGAVLGAGIMIRVDIILLAPGVLVWWLHKRSARRLIPVALIGMSPGVVVASWLNHLKFDSWSPLSYGRVAGSATLSAYAPLAFGVGLITGLVLLLHHLYVRRLLSRRIVTLIAGATIITCGAFAQTRQLAVRMGHGLYVLLVDLQSYSRATDDPGVMKSDTGYLVFYGYLKRSLLQSLPYLGVLIPALRTRRAQSGDAPFLGVVCTLWILPFALMEWHGGFSFNMRYFVPLLPGLAIITAFALARLQDAGALTSSLLLSHQRIACATAAAVACTVILMTFQPALGSLLFLYVPLLLALLLALSAIWIGRWGLTAIGVRTLSALAIASFVWAGASFGMHDLTLSYKQRSHVHRLMEDAARLEDNILVVTPTPEYFWSQFLRPRSNVAVVAAGVNYDIAALLNFYLQAGHPVYLHGASMSDTIVASVLEAGGSAFAGRSGDLEFVVLRP